MQIKAVVLCNRYVKIWALPARDNDTPGVDNSARFVFYRRPATGKGLLTLLTDQYGLVPLPEPGLQNLVDVNPDAPDIALVDLDLVQVCGGMRDPCGEPQLCCQK